MEKVVYNNLEEAVIELENSIKSNEEKILEAAKNVERMKTVLEVYKKKLGVKSDKDGRLIKIIKGKNMRKEVSINIQDEYIEKLEYLCLEQDTHVDNLINRLLEQHFSREIVCIGDFNKAIKTKKIQYKDVVFESDKFEDLECAVRFYNNGEEVFYIEHEFFELVRKGDVTELIALYNDDYFYYHYFDSMFMKAIK